MSDLTLDEQRNAMTQAKIASNAVVLSNIIELTTSVVVRAAGKDIADTINREALSRSLLSHLVANRVKQKLIRE